jgi:predicted Ser/Thr protein kinase/tetratricopeptide (TPR) repeat protein
VVSSVRRCPDDNTLAVIANLGEAERAAIIDHASSCDSCRPFVLDALDVDKALAQADTEVSGERSPRDDVGLPPSIDRYRIDRRIGAGAMGVVFAGYDPELARPVAVKVLRRGASSERMKREAQALAQLAHPNVVAVYDVGEQDGSTFVAMALVDGDNLRTWLETPRDTAAILDAIVQAARGLEVAHAAGIVHRDIKPDNIFVAKTGKVLVGDFGLARMSEEAPVPIEDSLLSSNELTGTGAVVGTPAYMAPEQASGEATAATDQFALCVTAWEALYGSRPFTGRTLAELVASIRKGPPTAPRTRNVPSRMRAAIQRGLSADPRDRYPSMAAFLTALQPRRRWPYVAAGAGVLAIAAGAAAFAMRETDEDRIARAVEACSRVEKPSGWTFPPGLTPGATDALTRAFERYATEWQELARTTCVAGAKRELSAPMVAATNRCLEYRRDTLLWILSPAYSVPFAHPMYRAEALDPIEVCRDSPATAPPSAELAELQRDLARASVVVHESPERAVGMDPLLARAMKLGDPHAIAEANYFVGVARFAQGADPTEALRGAITAAERVTDARIRARASAVLARYLAQKDLVREATVVRDVAVSAAQRANDPRTQVEVERANQAIASARRDREGQVEAERRIAAIQLAQLGELALSLADTRMLSTYSLRLTGRVDEAKRNVDLAIETMKRIFESPRVVLEAAYSAERDPAARIRIQEQAIALARSEGDPTVLAKQISIIANDYELLGDHSRALAALQESIAIAPVLDESHVEAALRNAVIGAERTDDPDVRKRYVDDGLALLERLPTTANERPAVQSHRGNLLLLAGRASDALPYLEKALAAAERSEPQIPGHIMFRSFSLAQALWETGGQRDRERAVALAAQAERRIPEVREDMLANGFPSLLDRLEAFRLRVQAWRRTHK